MNKIPAPPPPPCRVVVDYGIMGELHFRSKEEYEAYKAEPWWKKLFCLTAYDRAMMRGGE